MSRRRRLTLPIETDRLRLREFGPDDLDGITALYCDPRITRHMLFGPRDASGARRHLAGIVRRQKDDPRQVWELAMTRAEDDSLIGACDLTLHSREEAEIGYLLARRHWRQGYATEAAAALVGAAFCQLEVMRVLSTVEIHNRRSLRVLDRSGLRWEATFRRYARTRRHWWDVHLYAISREDWTVARE